MPCCSAGCSGGCCMRRPAMLYLCFSSTGFSYQRQVCRLSLKHRKLLFRDFLRRRLRAPRQRGVLPHPARDGLTWQAQLTQLPPHREGQPTLWAIGIDGESPLRRREAEHHPLHVSLAFDDELKEAPGGCLPEAFLLRFPPC